MSISSVNRWLIVQSIAWPIFLVVTAWSSVDVNFFPAWESVLIALMALSFLGLVRSIRPIWTVADVVTALRFAGLLAALVWTAFEGRVTPAIWIALVLVVLLDLVDGWCARRFGASEQGALLDMETDQFTTLALALLALGRPGIGVWILLLPGLKYLFVLSMLIRRVPVHNPKPVQGDNGRGRVICATVLTLLLICVLPVAFPSVRTLAGLTAIAALGFSFSSDAVFLLATRQRASRTV